MGKPSNSDILVAKALRTYAERLCADALRDPLSVPRETGLALDRALRSCAGIRDTDRIWVIWRYVGTPQGWISFDEMFTKGGKYHYPPAQEDA